VFNDFWQKIKHRNVAKVAAAYAAISWVLLQAQEAVLPTIGAPVWVQQTVLFLLLVGFPIACLIAWASDLGASDTPTGVIQSEERESQISPPVKRRLLWVGIPILALIGLFAFYISPYVFDFKTTALPSASLGSEMGAGALNQSPRFELNLGETGVSEWGLTTELAMSPDGRYVAFTKNRDGAGELYVRDLWRQGTTRQVGAYRWGTDVHGVLDFSDDGEWVTFFDSGVLKRVRVTGGASQAVMSGRLGRTSGYHLLDDQLIYTGASDFLWRLDPNTGEQALIEGFDRLDGTRVYRWPELLPDRRTILVSASSAVANTDSVVLLYDMETGQSQEILINAFNARYVDETKHLVFIRESSLWAVPFDLSAREISGAEVKLIDHVQTNGILGSAAYDFSRLGRFVYLEGVDVARDSTDLDLHVVDRRGEIVRELEISGRIGQLDLSADASKLSYTAYENSQSDIWVWNMQQGQSGRRTFEGMSRGARWSADDRQLIYRNQAEARNLSGIWSVAGDGSTPAFEIFSNPSEFSGFQIQSVSKADDRLLFFSGAAQIGQGALWSLSLSGSEFPRSEVQRLEVSPNTEEVWWSRVATSPNGHWIAYVSNESGTNQVYVRPYPDIQQGKWQISSPDSMSPIWSQSTNELFFRSGNKFFSVAYQELETDSRRFIDLAEPKFMFAHTIVENHLTFPAYVHDSANDQFIILSANEPVNENYNDSPGQKQTTLTVIENWFSELSTYVPHQR